MPLIAPLVRSRWSTARLARVALAGLVLPAAMTGIAVARPQAHQHAEPHPGAHAKPHPHPEPPPHPKPHPTGRRPGPPGNGTVVGSDPAVRPGQVVNVVAAGFAPRAEVQLGVVCRIGSAGRTRAGSDGVVHLAYRIPTSLPSGAYRLSLVGPGPAAKPGRVPTSSAPAETVVVTIPRVAFFAFSVPTRGARSRPAPATTC